LPCSAFGHAVVAIGIAALLGGCQPATKAPPPPPALLPTLSVVVRPGPGSWFSGPEGTPAGFEFELIDRYAREHKLALRSVTVDSAVSLMASVSAGEAQLGAGGLFRPLAAPAATAARDDTVIWTRGIIDVEPVLIFNSDGFKPKNWSDLSGTDVVYVAGTGISESLAKLRVEHPEIHWKPIDVPSADALIAQVDDARINYAVVMSTDAALARNIYLDFDVAFSAGAPRKLAWALAPSQVALRDDLDAYLDRLRRDGTLARLRDRYYAPARGLGRPDAGALHEKMATILPRYRRYFEEAQDQSGLDWRLIAAIAYQESQWDPDATSETGVRGMMQFTTDTAKDLGLADRLDAGPAIVAAARYVRDLKNKLPARIGEPDRTWFALAAFNIGLGHLEDARVLAQQMKHDPDSWNDVRNVLPLLADPDYYSQARLGYARGGMPVAFVDRVRAYYDVLTRVQPAHTPRLGSQEASNTTE
jgi:membrane-bound lytic murein transglycosylase F